MNFGRIIGLCSVLFIIIVSPSQVTAIATLKYDTIIVTGTNNTLSSIASDISNPTLFAYNPQIQSAVCTANLVIQGALRISSQTLEMNTVECGEYKIIVEECGSLEVYDSTVATKRRKLIKTGCTQGYSLVIEGSITVVNSTISYMDRIEFKDESKIKLISSKFPHGCNRGFLNVNGKNVEIRNCEFNNIGDWGLAVRGKGEEPLLIKNSLLKGKIADILNSGYDAEVVLLDCDFNKIFFSQLTGKVIVKWTLKVKVMKEGGKPAQDMIVTAISNNECGLKEKISSRTDREGIAFLGLSEFVATPLHKRRTDDKNNLTPHDIMVYSPKEVLLATKKVDIHKNGQEVILYVGLNDKEKD
jgi:hypothetical protein